MFGPLKPCFIRRLVI